MEALLFDDLFTVTSVDPGRYDRVSRINGVCMSSDDIHITLDVNTELFPIHKEETLTIAMARTLENGSSDGTSVVGAGGYRLPKPEETSLADEYDYVMYGTVYKFEEGSGDKVAVYVSFGGLLLCIEGTYQKLLNLKHENIYILIRR